MRINILYKTVVILLVPCLLSAVTPKEVRHAAQYGALAKATIHVVDDNGFNVTNANVSVVLFPRDSYANANVLTYNTDTNGNVIIKGVTVGDMNYTVTKSGYYKSKGKYIFYHRNLDKPIIKGKWQPWNPTIKVILREKKNPIPMYAKRVETEIPGTNNWYGYDLMAGDWVKPYGIGNVSDILFFASRNIINKKNFDIDFKIAFTNKYDGFKSVKLDNGSEFKMPRYAPIIGYINMYERHIGCTPQKGFYGTSPAKDEISIFRIRTKIDKDNKIKLAYYGKFFDGFNVAGYIVEKLTINFTYYLNPAPNDRNLEFDPKKNLFPDQQGKVDWP